MKKLNNKGFTLVELLAVIIILAIVVGITIPAVLTTVDKSRNQAFETAADTAADWLDRQYQSYLIGDETLSAVDQAYKDQCVKTDADGNFVFNCVASSDALIRAAGLKTENVSKLTATFSEGRYCVTLVAKAKGDYDPNNEGKTAQGGNC